MRIPLLATFVALLTLSSQSRAEWLTSYSPITPVELATHTGNRLRACNHKVVSIPPAANKAEAQSATPKGLDEYCPKYSLFAWGIQFVEHGVQFVNPGMKQSSIRGTLVPTDGGTVAFTGDGRERSTLWSLVRHYDGKVSLLSSMGTYLVMHRDGTLGHERMTKISKAARFDLRSATYEGDSLFKPAFDCSAARIKEIRTRYAKVANNQKLKVEVVAQDAQHEYYEKTTHRYYNGFVAEEHRLSGDSGGESNHYTYFWGGSKAYFEYEIRISHVDGVKTEIRRYSGPGMQGPLCRCLSRVISLDEGAVPGPQFQMSCDSKSIARATKGSWE